MPQRIRIPSITPNQQAYIEQLSIDLKIASPRERKLAEISNVLGRPIKYMDEMTLGEASRVIDTFKQRKESL